MTTRGAFPGYNARGGYLGPGRGRRGCRRGCRSGPPHSAYTSSDYDSDTSSDSSSDSGSDSGSDSSLSRVGQTLISLVVSRIMRSYYPALNSNVRRGSRYTESAQLAPRHPHTWAQAYSRPPPELMQAPNRPRDTVLRQPNPLEAMNQRTEPLLDVTEGANCPHNKAKEEQNGCQGEQQDGHAVGSGSRQYGGMPPQEPPPPYSPHGGMLN